MPADGAQKLEAEEQLQSKQKAAKGKIPARVAVAAACARAQSARRLVQDLLAKGYRLRFDIKL